MLNKLTIFTLILLCSFLTKGQSYSNIRIKTIYVADSVLLDTLSIVPSSVIIHAENNFILPDSLYKIDYMKGKVFLQNKLYSYPEKLRFTYRVFPVSFSAIYPKYPSRLVTNTDTNTNTNHFYSTTTYFSQPEKENTLFASGNISRGISVGNTQNLVVNSNLNLQLSGKLSENIHIEAYLSDKNIPVQPDGYSQQIQEFDKVYIRIYDSTTYLQMGDVEIKSSDSHFLKFNRSIMGGDLGNTYSSNSKNIKNKTQISGAIAKGQFNRVEFLGIEAVQGPYPLTGANNETYIVILAGTEHIYLDGRLLQRGENADYVINYNTAELIFTPKHIITKDSRIIAEFEYSDKNYNRFLLFAKNQMQINKGIFTIQYFGENDSKNQPVNIDLSNEHRQILAEAGDDPLNAIVPNIDSVVFNENQVLYKMIDTLVNSIIYDSVLVHSYNADSAIYRAGFALVGENKGNYEVNTSAANGKVYKWVAPINNVPQGNYEPIQLLIAPKKLQVLMGAVNYKFTEKTNAYVEVALSNNDANSFSTKDSYDNKGMAIKANMSHKASIKRHHILFHGNYETLSQYFQGVDRFRTTEFNRDWNLQNIQNAQEHLMEGGIKLLSKKHTIVAYKAQYLNRKALYEGLRNNFATQVNVLGFKLNGEASILNSAETIKSTQFYRHNISINKNINIINFGLRHDFENNLQKANSNDSLLLQSNKYSLLESRISLPDSLKRNFALIYKYRTNYLPFENKLTEASNTNDISLATKLTKSSMNQLNAILTWRKLSIADADLAPKLKDENNFLARVDHRLRFKKSWLTFFTFYELGTGMETHKEYSYLEVAAGQGIYVWVDYNSNDIPELNEFEISAFPEEANYIRIYTPTNDYIKVYSLKLNETINISPRNIWRNKTSIKGLIARFKNSTTIRISQKHTNEDLMARINPFETSLADTNLIGNSFSYRNIFSFNRTHPKYGMDWIYYSRNQKRLLSNGFDQSESNLNELKMRWNITNKIMLLNNTGYEIKLYESEYFSDKNSKIESLNDRITIQWQPSIKFRVSIFYLIKQKDNLWGTEKSLIHRVGPEIKYSWPGKGIASLSAGIINVDYTGTQTTTIAYEMMEGHQNGENYKWSVNISRNLNKFLQLTINYNGRKPTDSPIIHTGQFTLSAVF